VKTWWRKKRNGTRILGARASPSLYLKLASAIRQAENHTATGCLSRTVPSSRSDSTGHNAQGMCGDLETGEWPQEWTFSTFISLIKKGEARIRYNGTYVRISRMNKNSKALFSAPNQWSVGKEIPFTQ